MVELVVVLAEVILGASGKGLESYGSRWAVEMAVVQEYDDEALDTVEYVPGEDLLSLSAALV